MLIDYGIVAWLITGRSRRIIAGFRCAFEKFDIIGIASWAVGAFLALVVVSLTSQFGYSHIPDIGVIPSIRKATEQKSHIDIEFVLFNDSNLPVDIVGFKSSCGCLVSSAKIEGGSQSLLPREERVFKAQLDKTKQHTPLGMLWFIHSDVGHADVYFSFIFKENLSYEEIH
jgi:hypothetical protein